MEDLRISIIQSHLHWENPVANRALFSEKINAIEHPTDLIVLPEMFTTGFTMNAINLAELMNGPTLDWMQEHSLKMNAAVTGSIIVKENGLFYNRLVWVEGNTILHTYDKRHTFTLAGEHTVYQSGKQQVTFEYKGWKIKPLICYDLRFPVWARNTEHYDLLLYVANWPEKRIRAWDTLLQARAIENMSYCVGVNRTGLDGKGHQYVGHSAIYDALGKRISKTELESEFTETISLNKNYLVDTRNRLQFLEDQDSFEIKI